MAKTIDMRPTMDPAEAGEGGEREPGPDDPFVGLRVAGRYRIERRLGEGGIGRVYRAIQEPLGRAVALKLLHPELSGRKEMHLRFEREARAASRLAHAGSVMVFDFGQWNHLLYLVMELVEGTSLDAVIRDESPLSVERVIDLGVQLCDALAAAHAQGLLHRDLKPENVLIARGVDGREVVKVCDYGLAYLIDESQNTPRLTRDGTVAGTPEFMAPEQVMNRTLDERTDLYALGCVLYEMVSGHAPFEGESSMEILTKQLYDEPEPLGKRARRPIPKALERAVGWALEKVPARRPQRAADLKAALLRVLEAGPDRPERPSSDEVQVLFDRQARAEAAGIAAGPPRMSDEVATPAGEVVVVSANALPFDRSALAILRAQGVVAREAAGLGEGAGAAALVVDVRGEAERGLERLAEELGRRPEAAKTVLVVGPDDDFQTMTRALELKIADFVPESLLASLPRKVARAIERARRSGA